MSAIQEIVKIEIERLRKEGESLRSQSKALFQKADALEAELGQIPGFAKPDTPPQQGSRAMERRGRAEAVVELLDANPTRVFSPESMHRELQQRVDPSLVSRLKKEGRIAKAKTGGYCSIHSGPAIKEEQQSLIEHPSTERAMTQ